MRLSEAIRLGAMIRPVDASFTMAHRVLRGLHWKPWAQRPATMSLHHR